MSELFFSIDIETDGPIPARYSMLSLGCAAFSEDGKMLDTFYRNFELLPGAMQDENTMKWWNLPHNLPAYKATGVDQVTPKQGMLDFSTWVTTTSNRQSAKPVCVAYPAGFDFTWVYWYLVAFTGSSPFSFGCIDMKTYAMAKLGTQFRQTTKRNMPRDWFKDLPPHTHHALDDAIEQGALFLRMRAHTA